jgi:hypothetical protein
MANETLKVNVTNDVGAVDASLMMGWPTPLVDYMVKQQDLLNSVVDKSNQAATGAYESQVTSESQSELIVRVNQSIADQENITTALSRVVEDNSQRITSNQQDNIGFESRLSVVEVKAESNKVRLDIIEPDYVSKSETLVQTLASPLDVATSYSVNGVKVVGMRITGFSAPTGTDYKGTFDANKTYTVSPTYTQAEVLAIGNDLTLARKSIAALLNAMRSHGLTD